MFGKKCSKCNSKVDKNHDFCPHCGKNLSSKYDNEDFGFLGKNDFMNETNEERIRSRTKSMYRFVRGHKAGVE